MATPNPTGAVDVALTRIDASPWDRYLRDPDVNVEKLKELFALHERAEARSAKAAFNAAFAMMQGELPTIDEHGRAVMNGQQRYTYARQEDIIAIVRPILARYGFSLRHRHLYPDGKIKIIGILSHRDGHSEEDEFEAKADTSGSKNDIQAIGSTRTYGERYTTRALLNIVSRDPSDPARDTDGHQDVDQSRSAIQAPAGFQDWYHDMATIADSGTKALMKAWNESKPALRRHLTTTNLAGWEALKRKASQVPA